MEVEPQGKVSVSRLVQFVLLCFLLFKKIYGTGAVAIRYCRDSAIMYRESKCSWKKPCGGQYCTLREVRPNLVRKFIEGVTYEFTWKMKTIPIHPYYRDEETVRALLLK